MWQARGWWFTHNEKKPTEGGRPTEEKQKSILSPWPTGHRADWLQRVNTILTPKERKAWRLSLERSRPFGDDAWTIQTVRALGLGHTIRREGRPTTAKGDAETT